MMPVDLSLGIINDSFVASSRTNEETVKELDRDVAEQYFEMYELPIP